MPESTWAAAVLLGNDVLGRPGLPELLDRTLARIRAAGITRIAVLAVAPDSALEATAARHGAQVIVDRAAHRGTAGALRDALDDLAGDLLLVVNGDTDTSIDIGALMEAHVGRADCTLAVVQVEDVSHAGYLRLDPDGRVELFEGPTERLAVPGWAHAGVAALSREAVLLLAKDVPASIEADLLPALVLSGWHVRADVSGGRFEDIARG
jgi:NDP-sugar pyrophosphorylase family protein